MEYPSLIPIVFRNQLSISCDDGLPLTLYPLSQEQIGSGGVPLDRVYLSNQEGYSSIVKYCTDKRISEPITLDFQDLSRQVNMPPALSDLWGQGISKKRIRVCILNGGGGLGDGILLRPALEILMEELFRITGYLPELDCFSMFPGRSSFALQGLANVLVGPMPLDLKSLIDYDAVVDFGGMLEDPRFSNMHMTDFYLARMGLDPSRYPAEAKEPFMPDQGRGYEEVELALRRVREKALGRPTVAVCFVTTKTRAMPFSKAAAVVEALAKEFYPVLLLPSHIDGRGFLKEFGLEDTAEDISSVSTDFSRFVRIIQALGAVVSVDTSAVHIAAGSGIPAAAIFNSIDAQLRTKYSPTVMAIQLRYTGRSCKAPCGISKSRAFLKGDIGNGRRIYWEFGYSCDEAVERDVVLQEAADALGAIACDPDFEEKAQEIRKTTADRFEAPAPCWEKLETDQVVSALKIGIENVAAPALQCPVCSSFETHNMAARHMGVVRLTCSYCGSRFDSERVGDGSATAFRRWYMPEGHEVWKLRDIVAPLSYKKLLFLRGREKEWDEAWISELSGEAIVVDPEEPLDLPSEDWVLILASSLQDPASLFLRLESALQDCQKGGGAVIMVTENQEWIRGISGRRRVRQPALPRGVEWSESGHAAFMRRLGIDFFSAATTGLAESQVSGLLDDPGTVFLRPSGMGEQRVELDPLEFVGHMPTMFHHIASLMRRYGRFLISIGFW